MTPFGLPSRRFLPRQLYLLLSAAVVTVLGTLALVLLWWHPQTSRTQPWEFWVSIIGALGVVVLLLLALLRVRRGQAMLHSLERNFLEFMDAAADMMVISTLDGQIIDVNRRTCELLGYKREELLNRTLWDVDIDCYLRQHPHTRYYLERGRTISYDTWYRAADGRRVPVESRARKAWWRDQPCLIELVRDITARKQADDALLESKAAVERARNLLETRMLERTEELQRRIIERNLAEKRARELSTLLSDIIDCMPSVIITVDAQRRVTQWNQQATQLTGIDASQANGKSLKILLPQFDAQIDSLTEASRYGQQQHATRMHARLNDLPYLFDVVVYPLQSRGRGVVIRVDDITERVRMEQTLVQSEKMLSLGGLAAGMAHEINNPLGAILQSAQNIERRIALDWPRNAELAKQLGSNISIIHQYLEKQRIPDFLTGIREAGERAAAIVSDMLSFARPGTGELVPIDLAAAMDAAVRLAATDYNQKKKFDFRRIRVQRDYEPNLPRVRAQRNQLEQVFLNLLTNAAQALSTTNDPQIHLRLYRLAGRGVVEVRDNGSGMEETVRKRVFEPFFTTKDEGSGTGLGLSVSYFLVTDQLHGQMEVESNLGSGSVFRILLPFADSYPDALPGPSNQIELPL
ncbi:PAS domain S-box protein [Permianibacter sp. IMCC34836]|uniref:PAS domain-containing sensor histidine kinase n=1 Tax=Permianibacter fluminis TaxID=2738515 RepID=UPI001554056C|nr:PAS domain S-box protein [Permianibacter fluminis]NQD35641.1 PAS domain S-box protein [Permianibacter fluminis]